MKSDKISLVSFGVYTKLNESLSKAEGWAIGNDKAERIWEVNPELAKVNIQYDVETGEELSYDLMCVAPISAKVQEEYPELLTGLELINPWDVRKAEDEFDIREALGCEQHTIDWLLRHTERLSREGEDYILWLGDVAPSIKVEPAIKRIVDKGITVSVIDNTTI